MGGPGSGPRLKPCGTIAAWKRHLRAGEKPCRPCADAHATYNAKYVKPLSAFRPGRACDQCGIPIPKGRSLYCSDQCLRKAPRGTCLIWPRNCAVCEKPFNARDRRQVACGQACSGVRSKARANRSDDYHRHKRSVRRSVTRESDITPKQEADLRRRTRKCKLCGVWMTSQAGKPNSKHLDHILPINQGGTHTHGNVRIICRTCNLARPKDGSDYSGQLTLWAQAPGVVIPPRPAPKSKPEPKPVRMTVCTGCGVQFVQRSFKQARCTECMAALARQAIELRKDGVPWKEIAQAIGYTMAGAHLLAQRHGLYALTAALDR